MNYKVKFYDINIGSNHFKNTPCAIGVRESSGEIKPVITAKIRENDNVFLFSFDATSRSGVPIRVRNNKPYGDESHFQIKHLANEKIVIETETDGVVLEIRNSNQHDWGSVEILGDFSFENIPINVTDEAIIVANNNRLSGNTFDSCGGLLLTNNGFALGFNGNIPEFSEQE